MDREATALEYEPEYIQSYSAWASLISAAVCLVGLSNSTLIEASAALTQSVFLAWSCN